MVVENSCSPKCSSSDIFIFNNRYENLIFCRNCSLLKKTNLLNQKKKVISLKKFNRDVEQEINTDYFKKQILENKSIVKKI